MFTCGSQPELLLEVISFFLFFFGVSFHLSLVDWPFSAHGPADPVSASTGGVGGGGASRSGSYLTQAPQTAQSLMNYKNKTHLFEFFYI